MNVANILQDVRATRARIDPRILARRGIGARLQNVTTSLQKLETDLQRLQTFVQFSVTKYEAADRYAASTEDNSLLKQLLINEVPSRLYELYHATIGNYTGLIAGITKVGSAGLLHLLGIGLYSNGVYAKNVIYGRLTIPTATILERISKNRWANPIARFLVNKWTIIRHKDKTLADLIYRRFAGQYASYTLNFAKSARTTFSSIGSALKQRSGTALSNAIKTHGGTFAKNALRLGRSNFYTGVIITGAVETIGAGIKIAENYAKYEGDIATLKRENAKVVGEAVYNTAVTSVTIAGGAVIGGAIGSLLGPAGTYIGATAGAFVGGLIGDFIVKHTPGAKKFVQNIAVKFEDQIYKGTEAIANTFKKAKNGLKNVANHVSSFFKSLKFSG